MREFRTVLVSFFVATIASACTPTGAKTTSATAPAKVRRTLSSEAIKTSPAKPLAKAPRGPFGLSLVASANGKPTNIKAFEPSETCAECHPRQWDELKGSLHSVTHRDTLYRRTAELARKEAGQEVYAYCSGCHTPQGVASGLVPKVPEERLPAIVKAGVVCDTCHQIGKLTGAAGPWKEPGNASFVFMPDSDRKFGPPTGDDKADHKVEARAFLQTSEFCASCHTIIHPHNGVRIEHTYAEWKKSVYAQKGIQCQDCHMRTVDQAKRVAATLKPIVPRGKSSAEGKERPIGHHFFVGGGASADLVGGDKKHAEMAAARLRSAARLEIKAPPSAVAGKPLALEVVVTNIGAGHNLPTSLTELREMWVDLQVRDATGALFFRSGALDAQGDIDPQAMRFGAHAGDKHGKLTYKPWEVTHFLWKRLIAPKASARDAFSIPLPATTKGPLKISARLLYRSAPPQVLRLLYGNKPPALRTVEMATASATVGL